MSDVGQNHMEDIKEIKLKKQPGKSKTKGNIDREILTNSISDTNTNPNKDMVSDKDTLKNHI